MTHSTLLYLEEEGEDARNIDDNKIQTSKGIEKMAWLFQKWCTTSAWLR